MFGFLRSLDSSDFDLTDRMLHKLSHQRADEKRRDKLRSTRPWELEDYQGMDGTGPLIASSSDKANNAGIEGGLRASRTRPPRSIPTQQWRYVDGYLELRHDCGLVLGVKRKTDEVAWLLSCRETELISCFPRLEF